MENKKYTQNRSNLAVMLVNFGGPSSLNSVKPFLYNLFSDPTILNFPLGFLYRKPLAWLISNIRDFSSRSMYKRIGTISPLIPITYLQAEKLQELLNKNNLPIDVFIGFRYCKPSIEDALNNIRDKGYEKLIILPLFPQYSYTTSGSVQLAVNNWFKKNPDVDIDLHFIKEWYKDEDYIQAYTNLIKNSLENFDLRSTEILFSAHSIPVFNINHGDPYEKHILETANLIIQKLGWKKRWQVTYQSKLGWVKWLEPGIDKVIKEIANKNPNTNILVVPISFTCEHVETIFEIGILYKEIAKKYGIRKFARVPALNTNKYLIQAMYNQIVGCLENVKVGIKELMFTK